MVGSVSLDVGDAVELGGLLVLLVGWLDGDDRLAGSLAAFVGHGGHNIDQGHLPLDQEPAEVRQVERVGPDRGRGEASALSRSPSIGTAARHHPERTLELTGMRMLDEVGPKPMPKAPSTMEAKKPASATTTNRS